MFGSQVVGDFILTRLLKYYGIGNYSEYDTNSPVGLP